MIATQWSSVLKPPRAYLKHISSTSEEQTFDILPALALQTLQNTSQFKSYCNYDSLSAAVNRIEKKFNRISLWKKKTYTLCQR